MITDFAIWFDFAGVQAVEVVSAAGLDEAKAKAAALSAEYGAPVLRIVDIEAAVVISMTNSNQ